jgi:predicted nucleotidyltransferase
MSGARLFTPEQRAEVAARVLELLRADRRVGDAVLIGSLATGAADAYSDVDVAVSVEDGVSPDEIAADWVRLMYAEFPVVHHYEVSFDGPLRGFLLDGLLEVDIAFTHLALDPLADEARDPDVHATQAGFFWHDVLHAVFALRRGRPWRALYYVECLRTRVLTVASAARGLRSSELKETDDLPPELLAQVEATLLASVEPEALLGSIRGLIRLFLEELRGPEPELADRLESQLSGIA